MVRTDLEQYYALYLIPGIGAKRLLALSEYFGGVQTAFTASKSQLANVSGISKQLADDIATLRTQMHDVAAQEIESLPDDVAIITYFDSEFPDQLKHIYQPPAILFVRGNISLLKSEKNLAIIGSRKMTDYGKRITKELGSSFASHGVVVTSGFATGVDTCAHESVFEAGGETIGVLGSGIDVLYPASNKNFAKRLLESGRGAIVSELPPGAPPEAKNFPWRNRIVSGMTKASIIIESEEKGGSMITASLALDQGRDIFALPGDVTRPMSQGPNLLIYESRARLFRTSQDILEVLGWVAKPGSFRQSQKRQASTRPELNAGEKKIMAILDEAGEALHIDAIVERTGLEVQDALVRLLELEFKDIVRQMAGKHFSSIF
ncbi:MAG: DNA-processing protein DprA [bacterium]